MGPRDHPRSRGVYWNPAIHDAKSNGSSPLARGLPAPAERPATGIADHPRSRGVYLWTLESSFAVAGSSPLARGLPGTYHAYGEVDRIIPARAGFTASAAAVKSTAEDHPRSRGVYPRLIAQSGRLPGSSPLARGLLRGDLHLDRHPRIIPARAGFTMPSSVRRSTAADHPRSRGVYYWCLSARAWAAGSSPLARGLRVAIALPFVQSGIIPARAGFTKLAGTEVCNPPDHPRSRGVYSAASGRRRSKPGIIPARAGFTVRPAPAAPWWSDHPRSRGVYTCGSLESQRWPTLSDRFYLHW